MPNYPISYDLFPGHTPFVELVKAGDVNEIEDIIEAIESTLGLNPQGDEESLVARLAVALEDDGKIKEPQQILTVGKTNAMYTTIQSAIDAITDNAADKIYVILVYPGVYEETLTLEPYVHIVGIANQSSDAIEIRPATGKAIIVNTAGNFSIENLYLKGTTDGGAPVIDSTDGYLRLKTVRALAQAANEALKIAGSLTTARIEARNCIFTSGGTNCILHEKGYVRLYRSDVINTGGNFAINTDAGILRVSYSKIFADGGTTVDIAAGATAFVYQNVMTGDAAGAGSINKGTLTGSNVTDASVTGI